VIAKKKNKEKTQKKLEKEGVVGRTGSCKAKKGVEISSRKTQIQTRKGKRARREGLHLRESWGREKEFRSRGRRRSKGKEKKRAR